MSKQSSQYYTEYEEERKQRIEESGKPYITFDDCWPVKFHMSKGQIVLDDEDEPDVTVDDMFFDGEPTYAFSEHCYDKKGTLKKQYFKAEEILEAKVKQLNEDILNGAIEDGEACPNCRKYWNLEQNWQYCPWCGIKTPIGDIVGVKTHMGYIVDTVVS